MAETKFVLKDRSTFTWPLKLSVPLDGGGVETQKLMAKLTIVSDDDRTDLETNNPSVIGFEKAFFDKAVKGFVDFTDADGAAVSDEKGKAILREQRYARIAVLVAHGEIVTGRPAELVKN
jgi:hypothetical protein